MYERPEVLEGKTVQVKTPCGDAFIIINRCEETDKIIEVFFRLGKSGVCASTQLEGTGKLISLSLQANIDIDVIIKSLKGSYCGGSKSCLDGIARILERFSKEEEETTK